MPKNQKEGVSYKQPTTYQEREGVASTCSTKLHLEMPFVIDTIENTVGTLYSGWPDRIYIINKEGKIHYKGDMGPQGFKPLEAETSLKKLL